MSLVGSNCEVAPRCVHFHFANDNGLFRTHCLDQRRIVAVCLRPVNAARSTSWRTFVPTGRRNRATVTATAGPMEKVSGELSNLGAVGQRVFTLGLGRMGMSGVYGLTDRPRHNSHCPRGRHPLCSTLAISPAWAITKMLIGEALKGVPRDIYL
jgi:hypothetical protein